MPKIWFALIALCCVSGFGTSAVFAERTGGLSISLADDRSLRMGQIVTAGELDVYLSGEIRDGDTDRFLSFVKERKLESANVVLNSPGGSLREGIRLGRAIRKLGFDTSVGTKYSIKNDQEHDAICASACAYTFAGGVLRFMSGDRTKLGLHQFHSPSRRGSEADTQIVSGILVSYLTEMGVDANAFALASLSDSEDMIWLNSEQAESLGFVNNGGRPTEAEIKIVNMQPYLKITQERPGIELQLILLCHGDSVGLLAGIVTDAEQSRNLADKDWLKRSYLEMDGRATFVEGGASGVKVNGNTVWLERGLATRATSSFLNTAKVGIWLDGFGAVRAGGEIDLRRVKSEIADYLGQCNHR
jgi:hypothetical protein